MPMNVHRSRRNNGEIITMTDVGGREMSERGGGEIVPSTKAAADFEWMHRPDSRSRHPARASFSVKKCEKL